MILMTVKSTLCGKSPCVRKDRQPQLFCVVRLASVETLRRLCIATRILNLAHWVWGTPGKKNQNILFVII